MKLFHANKRRLAMRLSMAAVLGSVVLASPVLAMESLGDSEMATATGQEGIALQFELRINADQFGNALTPTNVGDRGLLVVNPGDFTNCGSTTNFSSTGCRQAIKYANQDNGGGEWLVLKNFYGRLNMPLIHIDSGYTPAAATSYVDLNRFKDRNGVPLLASPNNIPVVNFSYPQEIELSLTVGGISMEHGATGYLNADSSSVGGLKISNSEPNMPAVIDLQGTIGVFGF